ncbi:hypothetical protein ACIOJD_16965 [Streptomyces sp. NPDC088116]|uniref:hypothetical protein n=1 Tax=Streptomyces sp. NPDC088116 TaxID=3365825 RepID=UPI003815ECFA
MGQPLAQKAAKAVRGQQPKKRPGKTQREAIKRVQAVKKAGGGKPAAAKAAVKKALPLPRGSLRAGYPGTWPACFKGYAKGEGVTKVTGGWGTLRLRAPADVGRREGVRPEQGPDREWRDLPRPEALGLASRCLAVQHASRPLNKVRAVWCRPRTNAVVKVWSRVKSDTTGCGERSVVKG